jgi:hypothetical protein
MLSATELGVDERASKLLASLPEDKQEIILTQLAEGVSSGTVKNASAYVVAKANGPTGLGIDDRAAELLKQLPKSVQKDLITQLREKTDINNPSAWMAKACLKAQREAPAPAMHFAPMMAAPMMRNFASVPQFNGGKKFQLDDKAESLLQTLMPADRSAIIKELAAQTDVRNPSAWVVKRALERGAKPSTFSPMGAPMMMRMPHRMPSMPVFQPMPQAWSAGPSLDAQALGLLHQLPRAVQDDLMNGLVSDSTIRNPSAWMVKAALKAGARPQQGGARAPVAAPAAAPVGGGQELDARALELLATLPEAEQEKILLGLEEKMEGGEVRNASGWVVKAALNAGATPAGNSVKVKLELGVGAVKGKGKGTRFAPF